MISLHCKTKDEINTLESDWSRPSCLFLFCGVSWMRDSIMYSLVCTCGMSKAYQPHAWIASMRQLQLRFWTIQFDCSNCNVHRWTVIANGVALQKQKHRIMGVSIESKHFSAFQMSTNPADVLTVLIASSSAHQNKFEHFRQQIDRFGPKKWTRTWMECWYSISRTILCSRNWMQKWNKSSSIWPNSRNWSATMR